jgi:hypothetical protein
MSWLLEETAAKLMQIAACQPVGVYLEPPSRRARNPFRAAGYSTAAQAVVIWPHFYPALSGDGLKLVTAIPTTGDSSSRHPSSKSEMP